MTSKSLKETLSRGSSTEQGYGSTWRNLRKRVLQEEANCRRCGEPSTDVDHIVPRRQGGSDERSNLQGLRHSCHSRYTAEADGGFGNQLRPEGKVLLPPVDPSIQPLATITVTPPPLTVEQVPIEELRPDPANPRRISNDQLEALTRSLRPTVSSSPSWPVARTRPLSVATSVYWRRGAWATRKCRSSSST